MSEDRKTSPLLAIAAVSVIIFSAVGVGVMTGVIPNSKSTETELNAGNDTKSVQATQSTKPQPTQPRAMPAPERTHDRVAVNDPASVRAPKAVPAAPKVCADCGVINAINIVEQKGEGSGLGAAGGAVVGGLVGNQIGSGRGNTAATIAGAVGGALAGNEVEKRYKTTNQYNVSVRMDDGNFRTFTFNDPPAFAVGDKVKVLDGKLVRG